MRRTVLLLVSLGMGTVPLSPSAAEHAPVRVVFDGDTIDIAGRGRVRLLGIDAPEVGAGFDTPAAFADEARAYLSSLVLQRYVHLEYEPGTLSGERAQHRDTYGRLLAYVIRDDGLFVNAEMLRAGLARVSARAPLRRLAELRRSEASAQSARRGMWGGRPAIPSRPRVMFDPHGAVGAFQLRPSRR